MLLDTLGASLLRNLLEVEEVRKNQGGLVGLLAKFWYSEDANKNPI